MVWLRNNRNLFVPVMNYGKYSTKFPVDSVVCVGTLPGSKHLPPSLSCMVEGMQDLSRALIPLRSAPSSRPNQLRHNLQIPFPWELRFQHMNFGYPSIQSIATGEQA
jgi:hypothetical protein